MERQLPYSDRITHVPGMMGGQATIRGIRMTVGTVLGLLASGATVAEILDEYPFLEEEDIPAVLSYAAWRVQESDEPIPA